MQSETMESVDGVGELVRGLLLRHFSLALQTCEVGCDDLEHPLILVIKGVGLLEVGEWACPP